MSAESNARSHVDEFRWWTGNPQMTSNEASLRDVAVLRDAVDEILISRAVAAHDAGMSWAKVGAALGITRQAAQKRFSSLSRLF